VWLRCANAAEQVKHLFGMETHVRYIVLDGSLNYASQILCQIIYFRGGQTTACMHVHARKISEVLFRVFDSNLRILNQFLWLQDWLLPLPIK